MFPALSHNLESAQRVQTSAKGCMRGIFHGELYGEESPNVNQFLPGTRIRNFSRTSPDPVPLEGPPPLVSALSRSPTPKSLIRHCELMRFARVDLLLQISHFVMFPLLGYLHEAPCVP